jgi:hypothetical protein
MAARPVARRGQVLRCNRHALGVAAPAIQLFIWLTRTHTNRAASLEPAAQKTVRRAAVNGQTADRLTLRGRRAEIKRVALQDLTPPEAVFGRESPHPPGSLLGAAGSEAGPSRAATPRSPRWNGSQSTGACSAVRYGGASLARLRLMHSARDRARCWFRWRKRTEQGRRVPRCCVGRRALSRGSAFFRSRTSPAAPPWFWHVPAEDRTVGGPDRGGDLEGPCPCLDRRGHGGHERPCPSAGRDPPPRCAAAGRR